MTITIHKQDLEDLRAVEVNRKGERIVYYIPETDAQDIALSERDLPSVAYKMTSWYGIGANAIEIRGKKTLKEISEAVLYRGPPRSFPDDAVTYLLFGE